jgi:peptide methionine sulfoxide reductase MsrB
MSAVATKRQQPKGTIRRRLRCRKCQTVIGHWLWKRSGPATGRLEYNANAADDRTCKKCAKAVQP